MTNTLVARALVAGIWGVLLGRYAALLVVYGDAMRAALVSAPLTRY